MASAFLLIAWLGLPAAETPSSPTAADVGVLRDARAVRLIGSRRQNAIQPVQLHGVVTFVHPGRATFFLQDDSGGVAVGMADERMPYPAVTDVVTITGLTEPGPRLPYVRANKITIDGRAALPKAKPIDFEAGMRGTDEYQWVTIRGRLIANEALAAWQRLTLETPEGEFSVSVRSGSQLGVPAGAWLEIRGVCNIWSEPSDSAIGGFFLFTPSLAEIRIVEAHPPTADTLTQVSQVRHLRVDEADAHPAVNLLGVVTFAHPEQRTFYLSDATGGVIVWRAQDSGVLPAVGTRLRVRGVATNGALTARVRADAIEGEGTEALPDARPIGWEQARTGAEDGQRVEMRGRLRQVDSVGDWLRLFLTTTVGEITVSIPDAAAIDAKVGAFLVVRGVCQSWTDDQNRIGGFFLYTPSTADVTVAAPPPANPFAVPEESIANLALYRPQTLEMQQVRLTGTVLHHLPGRYVVVQNATGVIRAYSHATDRLEPGDRVEIAGVPGNQGNRSVLRGAVYRRLNPGPAPRPQPLAATSSVSVSLDGHLVSLSGRLTNIVRRPDEARLLLATNDAPVEIVYPIKESAPLPREWQPGSTVDVSGLYTVEYNDDDEPAKFSLQLRSPSDLVVQIPPSWWTTERALTALEVIGACLFLGLGWLVALRRQVQRQTIIIRQHLEEETALQTRHSAIVEQASDFIFSTDLEGRLTSINPAGEAMIGYPASEALGLPLHNLITADDPAAVSGLIAKVKASTLQPPTDFETQLLARDGRTLWVEISARPIRENGHVTGLLGIARNTTNRKQMEELQRHLHKSEGLGRMAAAIAHHFNNQIQVVLMGLEMIRLEASKDPAVSEILATAERSAAQAAEIGTLMLTYLGQSPGERKDLKLSALCHQIVMRRQPQLPAQVALETHLPDDGPSVRANADQLRQALTCLVLNAEEAIGENTGTITLTLDTVDPGAWPKGTVFPVDFHPGKTAYACLTVKDSGGGITEANLSKAFDPFFTTKFHGRGMGLAVVLGIVRACDGAVVVDSRPGHGSTFRILLPVRKPAG